MSHENKQPVIKQALGKQWNTLDSVVKQHYDITPGKNSRMVIRGVMSEVYHSNIAKLFLLPGRIFGALVPYRGKNVPTEVTNWTSCQDSNGMYWHRILEFQNRTPAVFNSRMEHHHGSEIIEYVKYGMGIRLHTYAQEKALHFRSLGYIWRIGRFTLSIPNWLVLGDAEIIEKQITDKEFFIDFNMNHPLFGKTFSYTGTFEIDEIG